jgi:hypothetical protein
VAVRLLFYYSIFKGLSRLWKFWTDRRWFIFILRGIAAAWPQGRRWSG